MSHVLAFTNLYTSYVDAVTLDFYATVVVLVKERKRKIGKLEDPGIDKRQKNCKICNTASEKKGHVILRSPCCSRTLQEIQVQANKTDLILLDFLKAFDIVIKPLKAHLEAPPLSGRGKIFIYRYTINL